MTTQRIRNKDTLSSLPIVFVAVAIMAIGGIGIFVMSHVVHRFGTGSAIPYHESVPIDYTKEATYFYPRILLLHLRAPVMSEREALSEAALKYDAKLNGYNPLDNEASECSFLFSDDMTEHRLKRIATQLEEIDYIESVELKYFTVNPSDMFSPAAHSAKN